MNQEANYLQQRTQLLSTHLEEQRRLAMAALKAVQSLKNEYNQESRYLTTRLKSQSVEDKIVRLTVLMHRNRLERRAMCIRQEKELLEFDRRTDFEERWHTSLSN